ncbi:MAG TPA: protein translocase subunit SecD [Candidatus Omnitrophota bacterium]|nr:protein translocase subunit SecD [Candidatus Omnitrophota bacterium]HPD85291.1 protein translocase subunit SecD [Candidatus Omnitrophota bacterium]HRZ04208.1 protein translocase subunit SecD [Candidatus Omnitrophota bacterium]
MSKSLRGRILLILGVIAASLYFAFPLEKRINLGLDLKGGMHIVLKVETEKLSENAKSDAVMRAIEILRNRIDKLGAAETLIQRQGETEIVIQLPGVTDRDKAMAVIGKVAQLEFKLVSSDPAQLKEALTGNVPEGFELKYLKKEDNKPILLKKEASLGGDVVSDAKVDFNSSGFGEPRISLGLTAAGAKTFAELTQNNVGERLAIVLDGEVLSAPNIREPILSGDAEISGMFTFDEASLLALSLRSGALPAPLRVEEERTIGPLLGQDSIRAGINASIIGSVALFIFMALYYLLAGVVADIALGLNFLIILGIMGFVNMMLPDTQMTLTLPGIAGIILTLGMAVDANVLINERIREELKIGKPLAVAIHNGYHKAFSAIFDSNLTTLIAAFMLFQFGSGPIKGFAVTLTIGLVASLFTALTVTRTIFDVLLHFKTIKSLPMLHFFRETKIDFISKRYFCYALSIILIAAGMFSLYSKKQSAYGIDFAGGQIQEYKFQKPVVAQELRQLLKEGGLSDVVIQQFDKNPEVIMLRTSEDTYDRVTGILKEKMPDNKFEVMRIEKVGPVVGKMLRTRAVMALICALGAILIYVGFRFKHFDFAAAGVIALLHDVVFGLGLMAMTGRQIDLLIITALLTIAGYSINDTIVIYDRVRENMIKMPKASLRDLINLSVNQTLARTILTSGATMIMVISLFMLGGEVLNNFAFCLIGGFISGVYSTVYIASPLVLVWAKKNKR